MKKWLIAFTASAVLIGCGGGSGTVGGGGGGGGGTTGRSVPTVTLGNTAQAQVLFLSGQGRRAPTSLVAIIDNVRVYNTATDYEPKDLQNSGAPLKVLLDGYTLNQFVFDFPLKAGGPPKTFTKFPFEVARLEQADGTILYGGPPFPANEFLNMSMTLFPGRQTTIQVIINDQILSFDNQLGPQFDKTQFELENYSFGQLNGFLSDMISFDVSGLSAADRPFVSTGELADTVHFSGDSVAISGPFHLVNNVPQATIDMLNPVVVDSGILRKPQVIGGNVVPGIYNVMEPDPRDPFGNAKILAIQGIYRPYTDFLSNMSDFSMVAFPTTRDPNVNQVVAFNRDKNGVITAMWQGVLSYTKAASGVIKLYSLDQLPDASANPKASGTISFSKVGGVVKTGSFVIASAPANFPFPSKGDFVVMR